MFIGGFLCVQGLGIAIPPLAPFLIELPYLSDELLILLGDILLDRTSVALRPSAIASSIFPALRDAAERLA